MLHMKMFGLLARIADDVGNGLTEFLHQLRKSICIAKEARRIDSANFIKHNWRFIKRFWNRMLQNRPILRLV